MKTRLWSLVERRGGHRNEFWGLSNGARIAYKLDRDGWIEPEELVIRKARKVGEEGVNTICRMKEKAACRD